MHASERHCPVERFSGMSLEFPRRSVLSLIVSISTETSSTCQYNPYSLARPQPSTALADRPRTTDSLHRRTSGASARPRHLSSSSLDVWYLPGSLFHSVRRSVSIQATVHRRSFWSMIDVRLTSSSVFSFIVLFVLPVPVIERVEVELVVLVEPPRD